MTYAHFSQSNLFPRDKIKWPFTFSLIAHPVSIFKFKIQIFQIYVRPVKQTMWKKPSNVSLLSLHINWCEKVSEKKHHTSALAVCFHAPFPYNSCHTNMLAMRHVHPLACVPACFGLFPMLKCGRAGKLFPVSERFILWSNSSVIHSESQTKTQRQEVGEDQSPHPQSFTPNSPHSDQCSRLIKQSPAFTLLLWDLSERLGSAGCFTTNTLCLQCLLYYR